MEESEFKETIITFWNKSKNINTYDSKLDDIFVHKKLNQLILFILIVGQVVYDAHNV